MMAVAGILAAASLVAAPLPALPPQGLVLSEGSGLTFIALSGRRLAHIDGLRFESEYVLNSGLPRFRDRQGRLWALDTAGHRFVPARAGLPLAGGATLLFARKAKAWLVLRGGRVAMRMRVGREFPFLSEERDVVSTRRRALDLRTRRFLPVPAGCTLASRRAVNWILLCGHRSHGTPLPTSIEELVDGRRRRIAGPAEIRKVAPHDPAGYWVFVRVAADRRTLLAQWSGECESPSAFVIGRGGRLDPVGGNRRLESVAAGWSRDGRAIVHFTAGICGQGFHGGPGIYAVGRDRKPQLIVAMRGLQKFAFWGG
jgi:hypothetical protein